MNWVGGVRNRLKSSSNSERKIQKMYFERKQQERATSASANRNSTDVKTSKRSRKNRVSQDLLSFKMQSEINETHDSNRIGNYRVVNLGPTRQVPTARNGVNVMKHRRVDSVILPVSPTETPSTLDLSYSPTRKTSLGGDMTGSSSVIDLFGMPVERPVKIPRTVPSDESKHNYSVNSSRACREPSCTMTTSDVMPRPPNVGLQEIMLSSPRDIDTRHILAPDDFGTMSFTNPTIFNKNSTSSFKLSPHFDDSDKTTCYSEPLVSYSSSELNRDKWRNLSDIDCNTRHQAHCVSSFTDVPNTSLSGTAFTTGRFLEDTFEVNLVKSPQCRTHDDNIDLGRSTRFSTVGDLCHFQNPSASQKHINKSRDSNRCPDYSLNMGDNICDSIPCTQSLVSNDTEFYGEVPNNEEIILVSSPQSPPKPVFLPYGGSYYSPQRNKVSKSCVYVRQHDPLLRQLDRDKYYCVLNQEESDKEEMYKVASSTSNTSRNIPVCSDDKMKYLLYGGCENRVDGLQNKARITHEHKKDQEVSRKQVYVVSSGLDFTPSSWQASQSKDTSDNVNRQGLLQALRPGCNDVHDNERHTSAAAPRDNNGGKPFMSEKPLSDFHKVEHHSLKYNERTGSCNIHGLSPQKEIIFPRDNINAETKRSGQKKHEPILGNLLPGVPLRTSTPCSQQIQQKSAQQDRPVVPFKHVNGFREIRQASSAIDVLHEMSILENQAEPEDAANRMTPAACNGGESTCQDNLTANAARVSTQSPHTCIYLKQSADTKLTKNTPLTIPEKTGVMSVPVLTSKNNDCTENTASSQPAEITVLYTPAQSISSLEARVKSPPSANVIANIQAFATHDKDSRGRVTTESALDGISINTTYGVDSIHRNRGMDSTLSIDIADNCTQIDTGTDPQSPVTKTYVSRKHKITTGTQTTPKRLQDMASSPIKVFSQEGPRRQSEPLDTNSTDSNKGKIYCLRSRYKTE